MLIISVIDTVTVFPSLCNGFIKLTARDCRVEDCGRAGGLSATAQDKGDKAASGSQLATLYSDVKIAASTVTHHPLQLTFLADAHLTDCSQPHLHTGLLTPTMAFVGVDDGDDDGDDVADNEVGSSISRSHNQRYKTGFSILFIFKVFYSIFFPLTIHQTFFLSVNTFYHHYHPHTHSYAHSGVQLYLGNIRRDIGLMKRIQTHELSRQSLLAAK